MPRYGAHYLQKTRVDGDWLKRSNFVNCDKTSPIFFSSIRAFDSLTTRYLCIPWGNIAKTYIDSGSKLSLTRIGKHFRAVVYNNMTENILFRNFSLAISLMTSKLRNLKIIDRYSFCTALAEHALRWTFQSVWSFIKCHPLPHWKCFNKSLKITSIIWKKIFIENYFGKRNHLNGQMIICIERWENSLTSNYKCLKSSF